MTRSQRSPGTCPLSSEEKIPTTARIFRAEAGVILVHISSKVRHEVKQRLTSFNTFQSGTNLCGANQLLSSSNKLDMHGGQPHQSSKVCGAETPLSLRDSLEIEAGRLAAKQVTLSPRCAPVFCVILSFSMWADILNLLAQRSVGMADYSYEMIAPKQAIQSTTESEPGPASTSYPGLRTEQTLSPRTRVRRVFSFAQLLFFALTFMNS